MKPTGVLALCAYGIVRPRFDANSTERNEKLRKLLWNLDVDLQKRKFWETDRDMLIHDYANVRLPFEDKVEIREDESIFQQQETDVSSFLSYMDTWSGLRRYRNMVDDAPLWNQFLQKFWECVPPSTTEKKPDEIDHSVVSVDVPKTLIRSSLLYGITSPAFLAKRCALLLPQNANSMYILKM